MKKILMRCVLYLVILAVFLGGVGIYGMKRSAAEFYFNVNDRPMPADLQDITPPKLDPNKPTVALVMDVGTTEIFDFLMPYELFSMTEKYNVVSVASDTKLRTLSGGVDLFPNYSFAQLDALLGKSPDIIVIPYMPSVNQAGYQPVREWIQKHGETTLLSICGGSGNLADTGLLKGKSATSHWQAIDLELQKKYPDTEWLKDHRYVAQGNIVTSGGQTGGIDAVLYVISQKLGMAEAEKLSNDIHYPTFQFVQNPVVAPYSVDLKYSTYVLNKAFQWNKTQTGVMLYNGMDEMAMSSVFDAFADTGTTQVSTFASVRQPVVTKHGLTLLPRYTYADADAPKLDHMYVTGIEAKSLASDEIQKYNAQSKQPSLQYMHADEPERFVFEQPLEALAKQEDMMTAKHGVKRFEYRGQNLHLESSSAMPYDTYSELLLTVLLAVLTAWAIDRRFLSKRSASRKKTELSA
ncbi:DJ-1/PfpI family protein [Tumebacillus flagellatus]|uniref:DJ-1/PfpI family protein n=1 Tax=Tumebacillus flagellatus TaxID=1157490 RepID=A0A074MGR7_9BACL|nr:DJ-1/PfpI family protein [Tumebacillus flagellatus]KEO84922.1 DJ-1/PfpI family protein [Tumebacillus flagellatus]